ncbi:MAG: hypothetical protein L0H64_21995, partial [Pseudonocardia sp.]|nr:hypothetical protein [Pseudonocardia sp.]
MPRQAGDVEPRGRRTDPAPQVILATVQQGDRSAGVAALGVGEPDGELGEAAPQLALVGGGATAVAATGSLSGAVLLCFLCVSLVARLFLDGFNDATSAIVAAVVSAGLIAITPEFGWLPIALAGGYG